MAETPLDEEELMRWAMGDEVSKARSTARRRSPLAQAQDEVMTETSHKIWSRRVLDPKTMALVNLGILSAINRPHQLESRMRGLLRGGIRPEEIAEVLLHTAFYCGNPAGVESLIALVDIVDDMRERGTLVHEPRDPNWAAGAGDPAEAS
jgi:alkylhydroperoxidase/carboxymuconolactone decarboxylase family protein YurZ